MDGEIGGLGGGRRADLVLLNDALEPQSTWYGGELMVDQRKITPTLDASLEARATATRTPPMAPSTCPSR